MHERLYKGLTLSLTGNLLFILFGFTSFIYYHIYDPESTAVKIVAFIAYIIEIFGFSSLLFGDYLISTAIRMRSFLKISFTVYIFVEVAMMILELNTYRIENFYKPYSLVLAIIHSVFSAVVCFSFLQLDPDKTVYEIINTVCIGIILGGMLGNIMGIRIYFSIITNAVALSILFWSIKFLLKREDIEIDCHGDRARVAEYRSIIVDDNKNDNQKSTENKIDESDKP